MVQQNIKRPQVRRLHLDLREGGGLLGRLHGGRNGRVRDRRGGHHACMVGLPVAAESRAQGVLHRHLAVPRRQMQDLQVLLRGVLLRVLPAQRVVGHAEVARGEQVFMVLVVGESPRLADQRVDDVAIVDGVLADARQSRHALDQRAGVPDFHFLDADHHVHLVADQAAVDRVGVPQDLDRARHANGDVAQAAPAAKPCRRQRTQRGQFFREPLLPPRVAGVDQLTQKALVLLAIGEVAAAAQVQRLVHRVLEVPVRRLGVAVLVRLADVGPLAFENIVLQELAIPLVKLPFLAQVVHGRRKAVAAVPPRHASQFPQRILQALAEGLERLRRAERDRLPVGIRQREVIRQMGEGPAGERHRQRFEVGEVRGRQVARMVDLGEHHRLPRPLRGPPETDLALKGAPLAVGELSGGLALQPAEQRHCPQRRLGLKPLFDLRPDRGERIKTGPPVAGSRAFRWQLPKLPIFTRRLLVHARSPGRRGQRLTCEQQTTQLSHLTVLDHCNLLSNKRLRL